MLLMKGQRMPKSWHGCSPMYGLFNCTTENTQKKQYQDVEATDRLPSLAEYLTRHSNVPDYVVASKKKTTLGRKFRYRYTLAPLRPLVRRSMMSLKL